jgi:hypothetical protein
VPQSSSNVFAYQPKKVAANDSLLLNTSFYVAKPIEEAKEKPVISKDKVAPENVGVFVDGVQSCIVRPSADMAKFIEIQR